MLVSTNDMILDARLQGILVEYQLRLVELLGDKLDSIVLYGSQARGDATEGSDIDVLCVMKEPFDYAEMLDLTSKASAELSLKYDVVLSTTFVTRRDFESRNIPFLMNVRREGIRL